MTLEERVIALEKEVQRLVQLTYPIQKIGPNHHITPKGPMPLLDFSGIKLKGGK